MIWSFFVLRFVEESALCDYMMEELVVFNDPDDDEYEEEELGAEYYLGEELAQDYWIYKMIAKGDAGVHLKLFYETSRLDVYKMLAYTLTHAKEKSKLERRIRHGRRY